MTFMNDNAFMVELTEEELIDVNGAGGYGFGGCDTCGFSVPYIPTCSSCGFGGVGGFGFGPYISAYSTESSNTLTYNVNYAASNVNKTSYFTLIN